MERMKNAVAREEIPVVEPKSNQTECVAGNVECLEFVPSDRKHLAVVNEGEGTCDGQHVDGMNGVVRMQIVGSTGLGGKRKSAADVVSAAMGVNHRFDREAPLASQSR
jgi:hypothetical protein